MKKILLLVPTPQSANVQPALLEKIEHLNLAVIRDRMLFKHQWNEERIDGAFIGYRQYLYLTQVLEMPVAPTPDIDLVWHEHILHTNKYAADCQILFGKFLHHFPTPVKWKTETTVAAGVFCCNKADCCNDDPRVDVSMVLEGSSVYVSKSTTSAHAECGEPAPGGCAPIGGSESYCGGTTNDGFIDRINYDDPQKNFFKQNLMFEDVVQGYFIN